jgi:hypothetical protein
VGLPAQLLPALAEVLFSAVAGVEVGGGGREREEIRALVRTARTWWTIEGGGEMDEGEMDEGE